MRSHNLLNTALFLPVVLAIIIMSFVLPTINIDKAKILEFKKPVFETKTEKVVVVEPEKIKKVVDEKQLKCLADNIYFEAGRESTEGKAAVARVVLNRINHGFASIICNVVYQSTTVPKLNEDTLEMYHQKFCQFSWVCEGKGNPNTHTHHYKKSLEVARDVLETDAYNDIIPASVLFFHNTSVNPDIEKGYVKQIGNHIFYSKKSKQVKNGSKKRVKKSTQ